MYWISVNRRVPTSVVLPNFGTAFGPLMLWESKFNVLVRRPSFNSQHSIVNRFMLRIFQVIGALMFLITPLSLQRMWTDTAYQFPYQFLTIGIHPSSGITEKTLHCWKVRVRHLNNPREMGCHMPPSITDRRKPVKVSKRMLSKVPFLRKTELDCPMLGYKLHTDKLAPWNLWKAKQNATCKYPAVAK